MIKIIGTSHIAKQSTREIKEKIAEWKPDIVAVELDIARLHSLFQKEKSIELKDIWKLGFFGFVFAKIGAWLQKSLGKSVGILPGSDMKTAVMEAKKVGAKIYLIDRPLQLTLQRLGSEMSIWEKFGLIGHILFGWVNPENREILKQINLTKVPSEKLIEKMVKDLKAKFPSMYKVLIEERNNYMSKQLLRIKEHFPGEKILAVVGAGHVKELKRLLVS